MPNCESVTEIARDTGIAAQTLYSWRSQWQKQGLLVRNATAQRLLSKKLDQLWSRDQDP